MTNERNFLDQPIKNDLKAHNNIRKIATGQSDDYITGCLLDYLYFKKYNLISIDSSKQQTLHADPQKDKKKHKKMKAYRKSVQKEPTFKKCLLILDFKPLRLQVEGKHSIGREFQTLAV